MGMAAEIDVYLSVRAFEELTSINPLDDVLLSIKMRPNYNVVGGHPNKTFDWQRSYFYIKSDDSAFEDPPDDDYRVLWNTLLGRIPLLTRVVSSHTNRLYSHCFFFWQMIIQLHASIRRSSYQALVLLRDSIKSIGGTFLGRGFAVASIGFPGVNPFFYAPCCDLSSLSSNISLLFVTFSGDWNSSYLPAVNIVKRRISLFTREEQKRINETRKLKGLPDLSAMMATQLGLPGVEPSEPPNEVVITDTTNATLQHQAPSPDATAAVYEKKGSKKRSRDDPSAGEDRETLPEGTGATEQTETFEPSKKKRNKKKQSSNLKSLPEENVVV